MLFENYVKNNRADFLAKVQEIAQRLGINPDWLMFVMMCESGLNPQAVNSNGGATGLIQFMPATAEALDTTTARLLAMSNVEQLDYVYAYYRPYTGRLKSVYDLYLVTFFPAALGKPDSYVFRTNRLSAKTIADANPGINIDGDDQITVGEFKQYIDRKMVQLGLDQETIVALKKKQAWRVD